jgi:hypothetical protein
LEFFYFFLPRPRTRVVASRSGNDQERWTRLHEPALKVIKDIAEEGSKLIIIKQSHILSHHLVILWHVLPQRTVLLKRQHLFSLSSLASPPSLRPNNSIEALAVL